MSASSRLVSSTGQPVESNPTEYESADAFGDQPLTLHALQNVLIFADRSQRPFHRKRQFGAARQLTSETSEVTMKRDGVRIDDLGPWIRAQVAAHPCWRLKPLQNHP
jgi:hypothetical protein